MSREQPTVDLRIVERERHWRALCYSAMAFALAAFSYAFLDFDAVQALGYAVACYLMLNLVNRRAMFSRLPEKPKPQSAPRE